MHIPAKFLAEHVELVSIPLAPLDEVQAPITAAAKCGEAYAIANPREFPRTITWQMLERAADGSIRSEEPTIAILERAAFVAGAHHVVRARLRGDPRTSSIVVHGAYLQHMLVRIAFSGEALWQQFRHAMPERLLPAQADELGSHRAAAAASALCGPTCRVFLPTVLGDIIEKTDLIVFDKGATYLIQIRGGEKTRVLDPMDQSNRALIQGLKHGCHEMLQRYGIRATAKYIEIPGTVRDLKGQIARRAS